MEEPLNYFSPAVPQFGELQMKWPYRLRHSVYGLATDEKNQLLVVSAKDMVFLPGGGIDAGESAEEALRRETLEETGWHALVEDEVCCARQYLVSRRKSKAVNKHGRFFRMNLLQAAGPPLEKDHQPFWMDIREAAQILRHDFHRWAVEQLDA